MFDKIKNYFMVNKSNTMFSGYVTYFPTINKQLKLQRGGRINVIDKITNEVEIFNNWDDLNYKYQLYPIEIEIPNEPKMKYWCYGNANRANELVDYFSNYYGVNKAKISTGFKNPNKIYYLDHNKDLCETSSQLVIDLLVNSKEWQQYKLEVKKYTKEDIAKVLGLTVDQFEIV